MRTHFVSINDAKKIIFRKFTLHDPDLVIKKANTDGTFSLSPVINTSTYSKDDLDGYSYECAAKGQELLVEVNLDKLGNIDFSNVKILTFDKLENGDYYEVVSDFEPRQVRLLEFDFAKSFNKMSLNQYKTVVVLPSKIDRESLFLSEKSSVITVGDNLTRRREILGESRLGSDLYILPKNSELLDENPSWTVELEETDKNIFQMRKRIYYFVRPLSKEELTFLSPEELVFYQLLTRNKSQITMNAENNKLIKTGETSIDTKQLIKVSRLDLEILLTNSIENMPLKHLFEVYNQEGMKLNQISLDEAFGTQSKKSI